MRRYEAAVACFPCGEVVRSGVRAARAGIWAADCIGDQISSSAGAIFLIYRVLLPEDKNTKPQPGEFQGCLWCSGGRATGQEIILVRSGLGATIAESRRTGRYK